MDCWLAIRIFSTGPTVHWALFVAIATVTSICSLVGTNLAFGQSVQLAQTANLEAQPVPTISGSKKFFSNVQLIDTPAIDGQPSNLKFVPSPRAPVPLVTAAPVVVDSVLEYGITIPKNEAHPSLNAGLPLIHSETLRPNILEITNQLVVNERPAIEIDALQLRESQFPSATVVELADGLLLTESLKQQSSTTSENTFASPAVPATTTPPAEPVLVMGDLRAAWLLFDDPAIQEMIDRVLSQNPGIREAQARIMQSRALFSRATADLFPQLTANAQHGYRRFSQNGNAFVQDSTTTQGFDWYSSGFDTRWEVDLFGRLRGIRNAANYEALAAEQSYRDVMVTLIGDLMLAYVEFSLANERIRIAQQNLNVQQEILEITRERLRIGEDGQLSVAQAITQVELTRSTIPSLHEQRSVALHRLLLLQGIGSQEFLVPEYWGNSLPALPAQLPKSVDRELLARRPDVRSARLLISAQLERLGATKAEYYPQVFINGTISLETRDLDVWWDERSLAHNVGPTVSLNLLDFGRIRSSIRAERAKYEQSVARYQQAILEATEEVRNAMVGVERQTERAETLTTAATTAQSVIEMAKLEYKEGITNFQNVLDSQRQLLTIQDQHAVALGTALISYARLFKALGGAWFDDPQMPISLPSGYQPIEDQPAIPLPPSMPVEVPVAGIP